MMVSEGGGFWRCLSCADTVRRKLDMRRHIEARHLEGTSVACTNCGRTFKTSDSFRKHVRVCTRQARPLVLFI